MSGSNCLKNKVMIMEKSKNIMMKCCEEIETNHRRHALHRFERLIENNAKLLERELTYKEIQDFKDNSKANFTEQCLHVRVNETQRIQMKAFFEFAKIGTNADSTIRSLFFS